MAKRDTTEHDHDDRERDWHSQAASGDDWPQSRQWVQGEIRRLGRESEKQDDALDELRTAVQSALLELAVLQTKALMLGAAGGAVVMFVVQFVLKKV